MRSGTLTVVPGYDGEYGKVRIFGEGERKTAQEQRALF
jgi:PHP family Zn ribbon phosphoesterase